LIYIHKSCSRCILSANYLRITVPMCTCSVLVKLS